jgi:hypothetical protein
MKKNSPIFIHSLFRTGSTYIWNKFRQNGLFHCYYEPFHQELAYLGTEFSGRWSSEPNLAESMGHPLLDREYMYEYRHLLTSGPKGVPFFKKSFSFDDFCRNGRNPDQKKYIDFLLANAGQKIPLLQFNRSALRVAWFKKYFPDAFHVYLLRDPRQQFNSFLALQGKWNLDIFLLMNLLTASVNRRKCPIFRDLAGRLPLFEYHAEKFWEEEVFYRNLLPSYSLNEQYHIHYCTWIAALLENLEHVDMLLNIDSLSCNESYRETISRRLLEASGEKFVFSDACCKQSEIRFLSGAEICQLEADTQTMVLKRIGRRRLNDISSRFASESLEGCQFSCEHWVDLRQRKLPALSIKQALIAKRQAALERLLLKTKQLRLEVRALEEELQQEQPHGGKDENARQEKSAMLGECLQIMGILREIPPGKSRRPDGLLCAVRRFFKKTLKAGNGNISLLESKHVRPQPGPHF